MRPKPRWTQVAVRVAHCGAGCTLGDIGGEWLVFAFGWTLLGKAIYADYAVDLLDALSDQPPIGRVAGEERYDANLFTPASRWGALIILVPVIGALGVTFLVSTFAPEARSHGVPEAMDAIYYNSGIIRPGLPRSGATSRRRRKTGKPRSSAACGAASIRSIGPPMGSSMCST